MTIKTKIFQMLILSIVIICTIVIIINSYQHLSIYEKKLRNVEVISTTVIGNIIELSSSKLITYKYNNKIYITNVNLSDYDKAKHNKFIDLTFSDYDISTNKFNTNVDNILLPLTQITILIILIILIISINNESKFKRSI